MLDFVHNYSVIVILRELHFLSRAKISKFTSVETRHAIFPAMRRVTRVSPFFRWRAFNSNTSSKYLKWRIRFTSIRCFIISATWWWRSSRILRTFIPRWETVLVESWENFTFRRDVAIVRPYLRNRDKVCLLMSAQLFRKASSWFHSVRLSASARVSSLCGITFS